MCIWPRAHIHTFLHTSLLPLPLACLPRNHHCAYPHIFGVNYVPCSCCPHAGGLAHDLPLCAFGHDTLGPTTRAPQNGPGERAQAITDAHCLCSCSRPTGLKCCQMCVCVFMRVCVCVCLVRVYVCMCEACMAVIGRGEH